jgi:putative spermidine/putrescine transport system permease protein
VTAPAPGVFDPGLAASVRRAGRGQQARALALVAPLLVLLILSFAWPILSLLGRAIHDPVMADGLPRTKAALAAEAPTGVPGDATFAALDADLAAARENDTLFGVAKAFNANLPGARSHVVRAGRGAGDGTRASRAAMVEADPFWGEADTWFALRRGVRPYTTTYLLSAVDLEWRPDGSIGNVAPEQTIYRAVFLRTFALAVTVTAATLLLGFPLAWLLSQLPARLASRLIVLVLLPFWTSILVRTAAWLVLLQKYGLLNQLLLWFGLSSGNFELMYTRTGLIIAMTHIQLPFTFLPIYSIMRTIDPSQMRAAYSLGARPLGAFLRVYLPQVTPGVAAGGLLTFILCLGYFITPALIGGPADQLISNFISDYIGTELNWQMAAALSCILLAVTLSLSALLGRLLGGARVKLT